MGKYLNVHGGCPRWVHFLGHWHVSGFDGAVNDVIGINHSNQLHWEPHFRGHKSRSNVSSSSSWHNNFDSIRSLLGLEIDVNVVSDLHQNPGPINRVDGAQIVLGNKVWIGKDFLDWYIQVIWGSINWKITILKKKKSDFVYISVW